MKNFMNTFFDFFSTFSEKIPITDNDVMITTLKKHSLVHSISEKCGI